MTDQVGQGLQHGADYIGVTIRVSADLEKEDEVVVEVPVDSDHLGVAARGETTHHRRKGAAAAHGHGNASLIDHVPLVRTPHHKHNDAGVVGRQAAARLAVDRRG